MESTFALCVNCGCNEEEVSIYQCNDCRNTYCDICATESIFSVKCPNCNSSGKQLGNIV